MTGQRSLVAIVFTDAVGFSTRVQQNEDAALTEMHRDFDLMREVCACHGGKVLKAMGDGLLMIFHSAGLAVEAAIEMQNAFVARGKESLQHRMGVHLSDVILEENDAHGDGVNVAARLESVATPGGICLSQTIYDVVKAKLEVPVRCRGDRRLKNLLEKVRYFEILPSAGSSAAKFGRWARRSTTTFANAASFLFLGFSILGAGAMISSKIEPGTTQMVVMRDSSPRPHRFQNVAWQGSKPGIRPRLAAYAPGNVLSHGPVAPTDAPRKRSEATSTPDRKNAAPAREAEGKDLPNQSDGIVQLASMRITPDHDSSPEAEDRQASRSLDASPFASAVLEAVGRLSESDPMDEHAARFGAAPVGVRGKDSSGLGFGRLIASEVELSEALKDLQDTKVRSGEAIFIRHRSEAGKRFLHMPDSKLDRETESKLRRALDTKLGDALKAFGGGRMTVRLNEGSIALLEANSTGNEPDCEEHAAKAPERYLASP